MYKEADTLKRLVDYSDIKQILAQHSRGIDRSDASLFDSVYHDDATVDYGFFNGAASEFATIVTAGDTDSPPTLHRSSNIWIKLQGDTALSESYVMAYSAGADADVQSLIGGRYLDRHSKKSGVWKIDHRLYVLDWNANWQGTGSAAKDFVKPANWGNQREKDINHSKLADWNRLSGATSMAQNLLITEELLIAANAALAKQTIHHLIMAQTRATDRADLGGFLAVWHPGAIVDAGFFVGAADEYCRTILELTASFKKMSHHVANEWIEVKGDKAVSESYVVAFVTKQDDDGDLWDELTGGRYLDSFSNINGEWKFTERQFINDWNTRHACSDQTGEGMYEALSTRGNKYPNDPVYAHWD
jgi:hypothetical protein